MNKKLLYYTIAGFLFVSIFGTLLHFVYEWTGENFIVGFFAPINESIWEHIKLLFFPMWIYGLFMIQRLKSQYPCISYAYSLAVPVGCLLIPVLFYTYTGIIGYHIGAVDIAIFFISAFAAFYIVYKLTIHCGTKPFERLLMALNVILLLSFIVFTYSPLPIPLFQTS